MVSLALFKYYICNIWYNILYSLIVELYSIYVVLSSVKFRGMIVVFFFCSLYFFIIFVCCVVDFFCYGCVSWYLGSTAAAFSRVRVNYDNGGLAVFHDIWVMTLYSNWIYWSVFALTIIVKDVIFNIINVLLYICVYTWMFFFKKYWILDVFVNVLSGLIGLLNLVFFIFLFFSLCIEYIYCSLSLFFNFYLYIEYLYKLCIYKYNYNSMMVAWYNFKLFFIISWYYYWDFSVMVRYFFNYYIDTLVSGTIFLVFCFFYLYVGGCLFYNIVNMNSFFIWVIPKFVGVFVRSCISIVFFFNNNVNYNLMFVVNGNIYIYYNIYIDYYCKGVINLFLFWLKLNLLSLVVNWNNSTILVNISNV